MSDASGTPKRTARNSIECGPSLGIVNTAVSGNTWNPAESKLTWKESGSVVPGAVDADALKQMIGEARKGS